MVKPVRRKRYAWIRYMRLFTHGDNNNRYIPDLSGWIEYRPLDELKPPEHDAGTGSQFQENNPYMLMEEPEPSQMQPNWYKIEWKVK